MRIHLQSSVFSLKTLTLRINTMKEIKRLLTNEEGSVLIVAIVILMLLTLLGIYATRTSEIELQIAGNERLYKQNLYRAEAAANEAAQILEDTNPGTYSTLGWLYLMGSGVTLDNAKGQDDPCWDNRQPSVDSTTHYIGVEEGIAGGASLDMTKTQVHEYAVYGQRHNYARPELGRSLVAIGYRRAF